jgi:hypothetical protein
LRFIARGARPIGPVAQWLEPAAHNGLVAGSSPARPTSHALDQTPFPESAISTDFSGGYRRATWNFGLTAGSFTPCGPKYALGLWRRFFSFRGRRRWLRQRPEFERPETGSYRRRVAAKGAGRPDGSNYRRALPVTSRSARSRWVGVHRVQVKENDRLRRSVSDPRLPTDRQSAPEDP